MSWDKQYAIRIIILLMFVGVQIRVVAKTMPKYVCVCIDIVGGVRFS